MKKTIIAAMAVAAFGAMSASAQQVVEQPKLSDNWSIGIDGGVTTPMKHHAFFGSMRGIVGVHVAKQLTPVFGIGLEGYGAINTSSWKGMAHSSTAFDNSYVGLYGTADLVTLFGGYNCEVRPFALEAVLGAGWGHFYYNSVADMQTPWNYFGTRAGLNFKFNVTDRLSINVQPSVAWNMGGHFNNSNVGFNINNATFNMTAGVSYRFGNYFKCVRAYDQGEVDALNGQINDLRSTLAATAATAEGLAADNAALTAALAQCQSKPAQVVKEVTNNYNSVRFVFFRIGSSKITADQQPNVEMIADYMKSHPKSIVVIKGYASKDGNYDFNIKLAKSRAESVKAELMKRYKIPADRIQAEGEGIGEMFDEESWNRVSICTLETK